MTLTALLGAAVVAASGCVVIERGPGGMPPMARLNGNAPAPALTEAERKQYETLNAQVLRDQDVAIAQERRAAALRYAYPYYGYYGYPYGYAYAPAYAVYGGWGWGRWGRRHSSVGVSVGFPGYWY
jgi:hypothetical protein